MSFGFGFGFPSWRTLAGGFSPAALFVGGVQGAWYDPSDLSTMFTTSTGTTPVAMPGQGSAVPVGLMLDKSQGLVLGANVLGSVWSTLGSAVASGSSVTFNSVSDIAAFQSVMTAGVRYLVSFDYNITSGQAGLYVGTNGGTGAAIIDLSGLSGTGSFSGYFIAGTATFIFRDNTGCVASFTNITLRAQLGNHAIAFNNLNARPVLMARVNLLTYSEEFDNGAWSKGNASVTQNAAVAPDGLTTADKLIANTSNATHTITQVISSIFLIPHTFSIYAKAAEYSFLSFGQGSPGSRTFFDLSSGVVVGPSTGAGLSNPTITPVGNGWYRCAGTIASLPSGSSFAVVVSNSSASETFTGDGTSGIYIWGADLRPANIGVNIPSYQRIAAALTYDTSGFPLYLRFDGIDDSMYTPANLNLSGTDKVAVFAGVRKLSDADIASVTELSANASSNNGSFVLYTSVSSQPNYGFGLRSTVWGFGTASTYTAPITNVIAGLYDIAGANNSDEIKGQVNGQSVALSFSGSFGGTGNFGTYPLYIGSRGNSSLWLNGQIYSLIIAGSAVSAGNIIATEQWVAGKTGIQI